MKIDQSNTEKAHHISALGSREQEILRRIYACFAGQSFDEQSYMKLRIEGYSGAEHLLSLITLRKRGYIEAVINSWGDRLYYIPIDLLSLLHPIFYTHELQEVNEEVHIMKDAKPGLVLDLFHVLVFIAQEKLPLTTKGIVHKNSIQKIVDRLNLTGEDIRGLLIEVPHTENVPSQVAIVLDLLHCINLVTREPRHIFVQEKPLYKWLDLNTEQMTSILVKIVIERYGSDDSKMQHWWCSICQDEFLLGQWVEIEPLISWMIQQQMLDESCREEMSRSAQSWLFALAGFGWMDVGMTKGSCICFRWRISLDEVRNASIYNSVRVAPIMNITNKFYVQPDFDIMVLPDVPYILRWRLMMFTDILMSDRMSIYRLTKDSITKAVKRGLEVEDILMFMTNYSENGVPDHVSLTLEQWNEEAHRTEVIFCSTPIDRILVDLSEYSDQEIWNIERYSSYKEHCSLHPIQLDIDLPVAESLFQGLDQIPVMWIKDFRSYHFSTGIQMMEQALLWKTKVRLSLEANANEVDFIPLHVTHNPYEILGEVYNTEMRKYERIQLSPNDWKDMRLIVPNFT